MKRLYPLIFLVIIINFESLFAQKKDHDPNDSTVIGDIKKLSQKEGFFSRLLRGILVKDDDPKGKPNNPDKQISEKYSGRFIRKINVINLEVFGASVNNPEDSASGLLQGIGNSIHADSKDWIIKNQLIFSEGDKFVPYFIIESERILRLNPYIHDLRIIPKPIPKISDSVDVIVYVQDVWSMNGNATIAPGNYRFGFNDINFLGYGGEFNAGIQFNKDLINGWDWNGSYVYSNIQRTFLSAKLYYSSEKERRLFGFSAGRDFVHNEIHWAGGIAEGWQQLRVPYVVNQSQIYQAANSNAQDYWLGYAFDFKPFDPYSEKQNRFNIAARITRTAYSHTPDLDSMDFFQDNTFYMGRIGFAERSYYQDRFLFQLGKTEDIPMIKMIALQYGLQHGASYTRHYYGFRTGYSYFSYALGYLFGGIQSGVFRSNGKWDTRNSILDLIYFSNMNLIGNIGWRHYAGIRISHTFEPRSSSNILNINNDAGLRGFSEGELNGNKKIVFNNETDFFTPIKFLGFKLAIITFADFGLISDKDNSLLNSKLYQGYGVGVRLKNEYLIFPPIQFMIGYYPNSFFGGSHFDFFRQSSVYSQFNEYQLSEPDIVRSR